MASYPVAHGDFAAFIADRGYARPELWLSMGWDWAQTQRVAAPLYWEMRDSGWHTFTLHGIAPIDPHTPICHINYFEADAFARWASARSQWTGARLSRETEWEHAAGAAAIEGNFLESRALHPLALRDEKFSSHPAQLFGDVWGWTQSAYRLYAALASSYDAETKYITGIRQRAISALRLQPRETVLDAGCGTGWCLPMLAPGVGESGQVIGFEPSPDMLAIARARMAKQTLANVVLQHANAESVVLDRQPDAILFSYTHDLIRSSASLENIFRQAKPGTRIVAAGPKLFPMWLFHR